MRTALHAEWTKLRTVPGPAWLAAAAAVLTVTLGALAVVPLTAATSAPGLDVVRRSLTGVQLGQAVVVLLAVAVVSGEYGTRMVQTTFTAVPRRSRVLAAKAAVVAGAVLGVGTAGVLGSVLVGRIVLPGNGFTAANGYRPLSLGDGATLRAVTGSVLYLTLVALLSLGVAVVVREAAAAVGVVLGVLYALPVVALMVSDPDWEERLQQLSPTAGLAVQSTVDLDALPIGPWPGLGVLALWAVAALALAAVVLRLRDV